MLIFVVPKRGVLDDTGCIWESMLMARGWNDLPDGKKIGRVVQVYSDGSRDVHFDALDYTATGIFPDELRPAEVSKAPSAPIRQDA